MFLNYLILIIALFPLVAHAELPNSYIIYPSSNYDGDTFTGDVEIWPLHYAIATVRVLGVDTPEIKGKCDKEKELANQAKDYAWELLHKAKRVELTNVTPDKYGSRVDAYVVIDGKRLDESLIEKGLGRSYGGEKRAGWCD